jgi:hypothetical protein
MSAPKRRTPPEKKELALTRDSLSLSDPWPVGQKRKKKARTRANRRAVKQTLKDPDVDALPRRKDVPELRPSGEPLRLQDQIKSKQQRLARLEQSPRKNAEARERRHRRGGS